MSRLRRCWSAWGQAAMYLLAPAIIVHEALHAAVAWPVADDISFHRDPKPRLTIALDEGTPQWMVSCIALAPTAIGIAAAPLLLSLLPVVPLALAVYLIGAWLLIAIPSIEDIQTALPA